MAPVGWTIAAWVWAYALLWMFVENAVKVGVYHFFRIEQD